MKINDLKIEHLSAPNAVDARTPRFSWKIDSEKPNVKQESYHIVAKSGEETIWDSGVVKSDECRFIQFNGKKLKSRQVVTWYVEVVCSWQDSSRNMKDDIQ